MTTSKGKGAAVYLWVGLLATACSGSFSPSGSSTKEALAQAQGTATTLSAAGEQELRGIVASGRLEDMQWPNFSDYGVSVKEFYDEAAYKLGWSQGGKATPQALEMIALLEDADQKGLDKVDYDGDRWQRRLTEIQGAGAEAEAALIKFD